MLTIEALERHILRHFLFLYFEFLTYLMYVIFNVFPMNVEHMFIYYGAFVSAILF